MTNFLTLKGKCSEFGGPKDMGVSPSEGLALYEHEDVATHPWLFLHTQPPHTTGVARRLNPNVHYIACRWDYHVTPRAWLRKIKVSVINPKTQREFDAYPVDWGPHPDTHRIADLSPGLLEHLELETDSEVEVRIPLPNV